MRQIYSRVWSLNSRRRTIDSNLFRFVWNAEHTKHISKIDFGLLLFVFPFALIQEFIEKHHTRAQLTSDRVQSIRIETDFDGCVRCRRAAHAADMNVFCLSISAVISCRRSHRLEFTIVRRLCAFVCTPLNVCNWYVVLITCRSRMRLVLAICID